MSAWSIGKLEEVHVGCPGIEVGKEIERFDWVNVPLCGVTELFEGQVGDVCEGRFDSIDFGIGRGVLGGRSGRSGSYSCFCLGFAICSDVLCSPEPCDILCCDTARCAQGSGCAVRSRSLSSIKKMGIVVVASAGFPETMFTNMSGCCEGKGRTCVGKGRPKKPSIFSVDILRVGGLDLLLLRVPQLGEAVEI